MLLARLWNRAVPQQCGAPYLVCLSGKQLRRVASSCLQSDLRPPPTVGGTDPTANSRDRAFRRGRQTTRAKMVSSSSSSQLGLYLPLQAGWGTPHALARMSLPRRSNIPAVLLMPSYTRTPRPQIAKPCSATSVPLCAAQLGCQTAHVYPRHGAKIFWLPLSLPPSLPLPPHHPTHTDNMQKR